MARTLAVLAALSAIVAAAHCFVPGGTPVQIRAPPGPQEFVRGSAACFAAARRPVALRGPPRRPPPFAPALSCLMGDNGGPSDAEPGAEPAPGARKWWRPRGSWRALGSRARAPWRAWRVRLSEQAAGAEAAAAADAADAPAALPPLRELFAATEPSEKGELDVGDGHVMHYRVYGDPRAAATALFLHGAPPPPSRTKWTRLVHPSVLTGHVSSLSHRWAGRGVLPEPRALLRPAAVLPPPLPPPPVLTGHVSSLLPY
jgi:hypothetical protein